MKNNWLAHALNIKLYGKKIEKNKKVNYYQILLLHMSTNSTNVYADLPGHQEELHGLARRILSPGPSGGAPWAGP